MNSIQDAKINLTDAEVRLICKMEDMIGILSCDHIDQEELFEFQDRITAEMIKSVNNGRSKVNLIKKIPYLFKSA
jgi:hypothetical protein